VSTAQLYRKRPVPVEAMRWPGGAEAATPIIDWVLANGGNARYQEAHFEPATPGAEEGWLVPERIRIDTLEGTMDARPGYWVIRGVKGEFYPCEPEIFVETYDPVQYTGVGPKTAAAIAELPASVKAHPDRARKRSEPPHEVGVQPQGCPFCARIAARDYDGGHDTGVYHFEPLNPVTPGHRLFVPGQHIPRAEHAPAVTGITFSTAARWAAVQGGDFNLIVNAGPAASQTVEHLHVHYVPRRPGDGLMLPWTDGARP